LDSIYRALANKEKRSAYWAEYAPKIEKTEICEYGALFLLDSLVSTNVCNTAVLHQVVERLERRYFSTGISTQDCTPAGSKPVTSVLEEDIFPQLDRLYPSDEDPAKSVARFDFYKAVDRLPLTHKVRVILLNAREKKQGSHQPSTASSSNPEDPWRKMDPVDMEGWEKTQFLQGEEKVKRTAFVEAKITPMAVGQKLRSHFALQLLEQMPGMSLTDLMIYMASWTSRTRFLRGDFQTDAQETVIARLLKIDTQDLRPYIMLLCTAAAQFSSPSTEKLWRIKLFPALIKNGKYGLPDLTKQKGLEHVDSPFLRKDGPVPPSLYGAHLLYSLRGQNLNQELIEMFEKWIPNCDGWTMNQTLLVLDALQGVRRSALHDRISSAAPSLEGTTHQWARLAAQVEGARRIIWEQKMDNVLNSSEETMLLTLRSMAQIPEVTDTYAYQDLEEAFGQRNKDIILR